MGQPHTFNSNTSLIFSSLSTSPVPSDHRAFSTGFRVPSLLFCCPIHHSSSSSRQDLTATLSRDNSSGFGLSSPAPKQPYTKPFSGLPSGLKVTSPLREAGEAYGERPGIVYPLLPRAKRPDTKLAIDAATLPKSAALSRQSRPPTVLDLEEETRKKENQPPSQSRRQPRKRRRNRSTGVYMASKRSPPRGRWCE